MDHVRDTASSSNQPHQPPVTSNLTTTRPLDTSSHSEPRVVDRTIWTEIEERLAFSSSAPTNHEPQEQTRRQSPTPGAANVGGGQRLSHFDAPLPPVPPHARINSRMATDLPSLEHPDPRRRPLSVHRESRRQNPGIDWIIPRTSNIEMGPTPPREKTCGERLDATLLTAIREKEKNALNARITGYLLNAAIGMQVLLGSLTTGLSVVVSGREAQVVTAVLGGFATLVASYLARARGSNEPELSIARVKDLEQFIRECEAFKTDHGHHTGDQHDTDLQRFRERFEEVLGNVKGGERRLSPPV